jgi:hypothetical protein
MNTNALLQTNVESSGIKYRVVRWKSIDESVKDIASILKIKRVSEAILQAPCWFFVWLTVLPWRWRWYIPSKRLFTLTKLNRVISQKINFFIVTAVRILNAEKHRVMLSLNSCIKHVIMWYPFYCWPLLSYVRSLFALNGSRAYSYVALFSPVA